MCAVPPQWVGDLNEWMRCLETPKKQAVYMLNCMSNYMLNILNWYTVENGGLRWYTLVCWRRNPIM